MIYLFDVDGTLTESRKPMEPKFKEFFRNWIKGKDVYLVTGSDIEKTIEQVGIDLVSEVSGVFSCSGNQLTMGYDVIYSNEFVLPPDLEEYLEFLLRDSTFKFRTGKHIEKRPGSVNFSILGRGVGSGNLRSLYKEYDEQYGEREEICWDIHEMWGPEIEADIGGETGIDIYPMGKNKSQVVPFLIDLYKKNHPQVSLEFRFYGDKTFCGGNDYPLAQYLEHEGIGNTIHILHPNDLEHRLRQEYSTVPSTE